MNKPVISLCGSAIRTKYWLNTYNKFKETNKVPFEMIYAGDVKPDFDLPENFKFIYTEVKPSQCAYIACMQAQGEYIMHTNDDWVYSDGCLDQVLKEISADPENMMLTPYLNREPQGLQPQGCRFFGDFDKSTPQLVESFIVHRDVWHKLGYDRTFLSVHYHIDIAMRHAEAGGKVVQSEIAWTYDIDSGHPHACMAHHGHDLTLFYALYLKDMIDPNLLKTTMSPEAKESLVRMCEQAGPRSQKPGTPPRSEWFVPRKIPVDIFENKDDLLTVNQGYAPLQCPVCGVPGWGRGRRNAPNAEQCR